jgi:lysine 2,3-aminomutase
MSDDRLEWILQRLREIPHVEVLRIGSRIPVVLPQRITGHLAKMLAKYHPLYVNTHFNHPKEITPETTKACAILADHGIPLGNQSVLLRGVNNCPQVMKDLVHGLVRIRVKPYYIYQCDLTWGLDHFRTTVGEGLEIMEALRGHTSGFAVPTYVIDAPGGGGKVPISPQYILTMGDGAVIVRNYEGVIAAYHEPRLRPFREVRPTVYASSVERSTAAQGGRRRSWPARRPSLIPESTDRFERRKNH